LASTPTVPVRPGGLTYTPVAITTGGTVVVGGNATGPDSEDLLAAAFDGGTAAPITTRFVPLTPSRILDTRSHVGVPGDTPVAGGSTIELTVAGHGGVPANGARAVVLNVTATGAGGSGWVTVWPSGQNKPLASNLNLGYVGQTIPNQVIVPLGDGGAIELFAKVTTHLVADVAGYFTDATTSAAGRFIPSAPTRLLDTRFANGVATTTRPGAGSVTTVQLAGRGPVPASGVAAVVVNITATDSAAAGYVTVWPSDLPRPLASSLNLDRAGQTIANHVVVPVSGDGRISLFSQSGTHLVADVEGYFTDGSAGTSSVGLYVPLRPARVLDTRTAVPEGTGPWPAADGLLVLTLAGRGGIAALGVGAVVTNVTATGGLGAGWVTAFPAATVQPNASNLNVEFAGQTIPNLVTVTVGPSELVDLYTKAGTHLVADVAGYYTD
jgi:hypothetical protein